MNNSVKMLLVFVAGVVFGLLAATSSLFQDEPEPATNQVMAEQMTAPAGSSTAEITTPVNAAEQSPPTGETNTPEVVEEEPAEMPEPEPAQIAEAEPTPAVEAESEASRVYCILVQDSDSCQCFDATTNALVDMTQDQCRAEL